MYPKARSMSLLAAGAAGAYLCSEAFVPGVGVARAQAGMQRDGGCIYYDIWYIIYIYV